MIHRRIRTLLAGLLLAVSASAQTSFKLQPVVHTGDVAPVPQQLGNILGFAFNQKDQVVVLGDDGLFLKSSHGITPIVASGDPAPNGGIFFGINPAMIDAQGQVYFTANVSFPGTPGIFRYSKGHLTNFIPNGSLTYNGLALSLGLVAMNASGDLLVQDQNFALYVDSKGSLTQIVAPGQAAPGGTDTFSQIFSASINQSGQVAFQGFLASGGAGIYLYSAGTISKIVATGDVLADGGIVAFPSQPAINDAGVIAFGATSNSSPLDEGLFVYANGQLKIAVPATTFLPNGDYLNNVDAVSINNAGQMVLDAGVNKLSGGFYSAVLLYANGQLTEVEAPGMTAPDGVAFGNNNDVEFGGELNDAGQILFIAAEIHKGPALYLSSNGQTTRVVGQGDRIPEVPRYELPVSVGIGANDKVLVSDSTFPGGAGFYKAGVFNDSRLVSNVGEPSADGAILSFFGAAMNNQHQVAVNTAASDTYDAMFLDSKGQFSLLGDQLTSSIYPQGNAPAINSLGEVAYLGFNPATFQRGLYLNSNGQVSLLVDAATPLAGGPLNDIENPVLNSQDQAAFLSAFAFPNPNAIYLATAGQLTPLARDGDPAPGGGNFSIPFGNPQFGPVINDRGDVAFATWLTGTTGGIFGSGGVFVSSTGGLTRIVGPGDASPDGGTFTFASSPSINADGQVAFFGVTSVPNFGNYLYSHGTVSKIAIAGDFVGKQQIGFTEMPQVNNDGHVAFSANLADGTDAVYLAIPKDKDDKSEELTGPAPFSPDQMKRCHEQNLSILARRHHHKKHHQ